MRGSLLTLILTAGCLGACDPDDVPRFSPDGSRVAMVLDVEKDPAKDFAPIAVLDTSKGAWRRFNVPDRGSAAGFVWAGARLLVFSRYPRTERLKEAGEPVHDSRSWILDPATGTFEASTIEPWIFSTPFTSTWKGKSRLFSVAPGGGSMRVHSLPDLREEGTLPFEAKSAGDGWLLRRVDPQAVAILNSEGTEVCRISREEIAKACHLGPRNPKCARVSSDGKHVLLGFDTETVFRRASTEYTYGVFRLGDGTLAWHGGSNGLRGLPVMVGESVYALEAKSRDIHAGDRGVGALVEPPMSRSAPVQEIVLARHTPAGRKEVLELPLQRNDRATRYSASADRNAFVLFVEGRPARVLVVPIREKVAAAELREFPLKDF